jgi:hypothetical protein
VATIVVGMTAAAAATSAPETLEAAPMRAASSIAEITEPALAKDDRESGSIAMTVPAAMIEVPATAERNVTTVPVDVVMVVSAMGVAMTASGRTGISSPVVTTAGTGTRVTAVGATVVVGIAMIVPGSVTRVATASAGRTAAGAMIGRGVMTAVVGIAMTGRDGTIHPSVMTRTVASATTGHGGMTVPDGMSGLGRMSGRGGMTDRGATTGPVARRLVARATSADVTIVVGSPYSTTGGGGRIAAAMIDRIAGERRIGMVVQVTGGTSTIVRVGIRVTKGTRVRTGGPGKRRPRRPGSRLRSGLTHRSSRRISTSRSCTEKSGVSFEACRRVWRTRSPLISWQPES